MYFFISLWCIGSCDNVDVSTIHHNLISGLPHLGSNVQLALEGEVQQVRLETESVVDWGDVSCEGPREGESEQAMGQHTGVGGRGRRRGRGREGKNGISILKRVPGAITPNLFRNENPLIALYTQPKVLTRPCLMFSSEEAALIATKFILIVTKLILKSNQNLSLCKHVSSSPE